MVDSEKDIRSFWMEQDGWIEKNMDDKKLKYLLFDNVQYLTGNGGTGESVERTTHGSGKQGGMLCHLNASVYI